MSIRNALTGLLGLFVSIPAFLIAGGYSEGGAGLFPQTVATLMAAMSLLLLARNMRGAATETAQLINSSNQISQAMETALPVLLSIALTALYFFSVGAVGFTTSSLIFIPLSCRILGLRNWRMIGTTTLVFVPAVTFFLLSVFHLPLPDDLLLSTLGLS